MKLTLRITLDDLARVLRTRAHVIADRIETAGAARRPREARPFTGNARRRIRRPGRRGDET